MEPEWEWGEGLEPRLLVMARGRWEPRALVQRPGLVPPEPASQWALAGLALPARHLAETREHSDVRERPGGSCAVARRGAPGPARARRWPAQVAPALPPGSAPVLALLPRAQGEAPGLVVRVPVRVALPAVQVLGAAVRAPVSQEAQQMVPGALATESAVAPVPRPLLVRRWRRVGVPRVAVARWSCVVQARLPGGRHRAEQQ